VLGIAALAARRVIASIRESMRDLQQLAKVQNLLVVRDKLRGIVANAQVEVNPGRQLS
jgi:hypothetical protein